MKSKLIWRIIILCINLMLLLFCLYQLGFKADYTIRDATILLIISTLFVINFIRVKIQLFKVTISKGTEEFLETITEKMKEYNKEKSWSIANDIMTLYSDSDDYEEIDDGLI